MIFLSYKIIHVKFSFDQIQEILFQGHSVNIVNTNHDIVNKA